MAKKTKAQLAIYSRRKGHNAERQRVLKFIKLGFDKCKTSRYASRILDDSKVDLAFIPYNVQMKAVKSAISYQKIFEEMDTLLKENFPESDPVSSNPSVIIHDRGRKKTQKFVVMMEDDWFNLIEKLHVKDK